MSSKFYFYDPKLKALQKMDGNISYKDLKRQHGIFADLLAEQNRYSAEGPGDKSILRSAFLEVPIAQKLDQSVDIAVPSGGMAPSIRGDNGDQPKRQSPSQIPQGPMKKARVLIELDGKVIGERQLDKHLITVGRLHGNDVHVPNPRVSRLHARIHYENNAWVIEDADSVNGIVYQGTRVERLILDNNDKIYIAPAVMLHYQTN